MKYKYHDAKGQEWSKLTHLEKGHLAYYINHIGTGQLRTLWFKPSRLEVQIEGNYSKNSPILIFEKIYYWRNILWWNKMTFGLFTWFKIELEPCAQIEHLIKFSSKREQARSSPVKTKISWSRNLSGLSTRTFFSDRHGGLCRNDLSCFWDSMHILGFLKSNREQSRMTLWYGKGKIFLTTLLILFEIRDFAQKIPRKGRVSCKTTNIKSKITFSWFLQYLFVVFD